MANLEQYSDEHRIFLQGIMSKGILNAEEVHSLLRMACGRCKVETPVDRQGKLEKLKKFIITINKELGDLGLEIRKALEDIIASEDKTSPLTDEELKKELNQNQKQYA